MDDTLGKILNSGGALIATTNKMRRGIDCYGWSPYRDTQTGGGDFFFARIRQRANANAKIGLVWKTRRTLRRTDIMSYDHDVYGRTTDDHKTRMHKGSMAEKKKAAIISGNETDFKESLSIFDEDFDRIVVGSETMRQKIIKLFREHGYEKWPDGRKLEEIVRLQE